MSTTIPKEVHGWVVGVELADGVSPDNVSLRIADALASVGGASIEYIGTIDVETREPVYDEEDVE